jgi:hypothetical protein
VQQFWVCHPSVEGHHLSVLLLEGFRLHVIEHTYVTQDLLDTFCRPSMEGKTLNAYFHMEVPTNRASVCLQLPRLDQEGGGTHVHRASPESKVTLLWIVEASEEDFRLVGGGGTP